MAEHFQGVSSRSVDLALALNPIDALTGAPLREAASVTVEGVDEEPHLNPSGYSVFLDPPVTFDTPTVAVTVESTAEYVARTLDVGTADDPPAKRIDMFPSTAYPFAHDTTLIEGRVTHGGSSPVFGATVNIQNTDLETRTNRDGSFALVVRGITTTETADLDEPLRVDLESSDPRRVQFYDDQGQPEAPTLVADHRDHNQSTRQLDITEGERHTLDTPLNL